MYFKFFDVFDMFSTRNSDRYYHHTEAYPLEFSEPSVIITDQASHTGMVICNTFGDIQYVIEMDKEKDENYTEFMENIADTLNIMLNGNKVCMWFIEEIHSRGYYKTDKILSTLKEMPNIFKKKYMPKMRCGRDFAIHQASWKSMYFDKNFKQGTKEDKSKHATSIHYPNFYVSKDSENICDALGIHYYVKINFLTMREQILTVTTSMKKESRHNYYERVFLVKQGETPLLNEEEMFKNQFTPMKQFIYNPKLSLEDNCRSLTSSSNKMWYSIIPEENNSYIQEIWWKYDIKTYGLSDYTLYVICYRENQLSKDKAIFD